MNPTAVLMYHAVTEASAPDASYDPSYAVSASEFERQVNGLNAAGFDCRAVRDCLQKENPGRCSVALTFDDGHLSNYVKAFPVLLEHAATADFFINTAEIGNRSFMSWSQAREMNERGMSIQSHGHTHRYLSDLADDELRAELDCSKSIIEDRIGTSCELLAPPGGRYDGRVMNIAKELGYKAICTSEPGYWSNSGVFRIPRLAVRDTTALDTIERWSAAKRGALLPLAMRYRVGRFAKQLLGNARYERIRNKLLAAD